MAETPVAFAVWLTGLPASGKSTVAAALASALRARGVGVEVLESDVLRREWAAESGYGERDRRTFYRALVFVGRALTARGVPVIFDATANRRAYRDWARQGIAHFLEVYVDTPLDVCVSRDPKGIYRNGIECAGRDVPGLQAPYEPPIAPDLVIDGRHERPKDAAGRVLDLLESRGLVPAAAGHVQQVTVE